jgi:transmembrane sensor
MLDRFIADDLDPNERGAISTLISQDPSLRDLLWLMRRNSVSELDRETETKRGWKEFNIRMVADQSSTELRLVPPSIKSTLGTTVKSRPLLRGVQKPGRMHPWLRVGAVLGVFGLLAFGVYSWDTRGNATQPAVAMHEMATQAGQHSGIRLADGTKIILGPQSRLLVSSQFGREDRSVMLEGEALFEVVYDAKMPLIVNTRHSVTRVLGTKFNVRTFGDTTTVAVVSGKVSMESSTRPIPGVIVTAGYIGRLTETGDASVTQDDVHSRVAWVDQRFVFRDTPMENVLDDLSRWYGVRFVVDDSSFLQRRLTADWENRSLEQVLKSLGIAFPIRVERNGSEVKLYIRESDRHPRRSQE